MPSLLLPRGGESLRFCIAINPPNLIQLITGVGNGLNSIAAFACIRSLLIPFRYLH